MTDGARLILQGIQPAIENARLLGPAQNVMSPLQERMAFEQLKMAPLQRQMLKAQLDPDRINAQLEAMQQQNQLRAQQIKQFNSQAESRMFGDIVGIVQRSSLISDEGRPNYIREQVARLDMPDVQDLSDEIQGMSDDELLSYLPQVMGLGKQLGLVKSKPDFTAVEVDTDNGLAVYTNTETGKTKAVPLNEFSLGDMTPKDRREFQKETRTSIRGDVGKIKSEAMVIAKARDKIESLAAEVKKGDNRTAAASLIMNLARLNSPGVVTETDFQVLSGKQDPVAAAIAYARGKDIDIDAILRGIDPTDPDNFDADAIIATANSLVTSQVPTLISAVDGLRKKAGIAELPDQQIDTIFADVDFVSGIKAIGAQAAQVEQPTQAPVVKDGAFNVGGYKVEIVN